MVLYTSLGRAQLLHTSTEEGTSSEVPARRPNDVPYVTTNIAAPVYSASKAAVRGLVCHAASVLTRKQAPASEDNASLQADRSDLSDPHHFILLQHGVLGSSGDFEGVVAELLAEHETKLLQAAERATTTGCGPARSGVGVSPLLSEAKDTRRTKYPRCHKPFPSACGGRSWQSGHLVCFAPGGNNYFATDNGTRVCAMRAFREFLPVFRQWLRTVESVEIERGTRSCLPNPVCLSCVGHSFGGLILRELLYLLLTDTTELSQSDPALYAEVEDIRTTMRALPVTFENFITVATPHCGTSECLWWPLYAGAWLLSKMHLWKTYAELIMHDKEQILARRLVDTSHMLALRLFRRRTIFANTQRDLLVGFGTSSLLFEMVEYDHTTIIGKKTEGMPYAEAFKDDRSEVSEPIHLLPLQMSDCGDSQGRTQRPTYTINDLSYDADGKAREGVSLGSYLDELSSSSPTQRRVAELPLTRPCTANELSKKGWHGKGDHQKHGGNPSDTLGGDLSACNMQELQKPAATAHVLAQRRPLIALWMDRVRRLGSQLAETASCSERWCSPESETVGADVTKPWEEYSQVTSILPSYRSIPRSIALELRKTLDWRLRIVRYGNIIPTAHVACLGNWALFGSSSVIVKTVTEEIASILT